jgi:large subunit ribosomal protein L7/L12
MAISKEEILDAIAEMSVMDIVALVEAMEEKFGVSAAAAVAVAAPAVGGDAGGAAAAEQTEFDVVLTSAGDKKVNSDLSTTSPTTSILENLFPFAPPAFPIQSFFLR